MPRKSQAALRTRERPIYYEDHHLGVQTFFDLPKEDFPVDENWVVLSQYENGRRVHLLWPTGLSIVSFFDKATETIGQDYSGITHGTGFSDPIFVPKDRIKEISRLHSEGRVAIDGGLGDLIWRDFSDPFSFDERKGGVDSRKIEDIPIHDLLSQTGTEAVVANLGTIVTQLQAEYLQIP